MTSQVEHLHRQIDKEVARLKAREQEQQASTEQPLASNVPPIEPLTLEALLLWLALILALLLGFCTLAIWSLARLLKWFVYSTSQAWNEGKVQQ